MAKMTPAAIWLLTHTHTPAEAAAANTPTRTPLKYVNVRVFLVNMFFMQIDICSAFLPLPPSLPLPHSCCSH